MLPVPSEIGQSHRGGIWGVVNSTSESSGSAMWIADVFEYLCGLYTVCTISSPSVLLFLNFFGGGERDVVLNFLNLRLRCSSNDPVGRGVIFERQSI